MAWVVSLQIRYLLVTLLVAWMTALAPSVLAQPTAHADPEVVVGASSRPVWLSVYGSGFTDSVQVIVDDIGIPIPDRRRYRAVTDTSFQVALVLGAEAAPWTFRVQNGDAGEASAPFGIRVVPPVPEISSLKITAPDDEGVRRLSVYGSGATRYSYIEWRGDSVATTPLLTSDNPFAVTLGLAAEVQDRERGLHNVLVPDLVRVVTPGPGGGASASFAAPVAWTPFTRRWQFWGVVLLVLAVVGAGAGLTVARQQSRSLEREVKRRTGELAAAMQTTERQAKQLQALDRQRRWFLAGSMHEMRTPLAVIRAAIGGDRTDGDGSPASVATLRLIRDNADRLLETLDELAELAELDEGSRPFQTAPTDVERLLQTAIQTSAPLASPRDVKVRLLNSVGDPLWADLDARAVRTIVGNLIGNAVRHTPRGGEVRVSYGTEADGGALWIAVEDDGTGVDEADREHVFERFTQGGSPEAAVGRSGVGLALALELADLHGGTVRIDPDNSARFIVQLPTTLSEAPETERALQPRPEPVSVELPEQDEDAPLVLIVDDERDVRTLLVRDLSAEFRTAEVADGTQVLDKARRLRPDLILLDVMLPGQSGIEVLTRLRQDPAVSDIPVVTVTARSDAGPSAYAANVDGHVQKPWDQEELVAQVQSLIATRRALKRRYGSLSDEEEVIESDDQAFVRKVQNAIAEGMSDPNLNVTGLADAVETTRQNLHKQLKRIQGTTPSEFLLKARMERAGLLLRSGVRKVGDVAVRVGYDPNSDLFRKHFKAHFGEPPSEYRDGKSGHE